MDQVCSIDWGDQNIGWTSFSPTVERPKAGIAVTVLNGLRGGTFHIKKENGHGKLGVQG